MKLKDLQFTPGPWHFEPNNEDYDGDNDGFDVFANGINNWLATVKHGYGGINIKRDVAKQNAILISHAPKMLELLKRANTVFLELQGPGVMMSREQAKILEKEIETISTEINNLLNS